MATLGLGEVVAAPPLLPPVVGLLQAAAVVEHDDDHWLAGIRWAPGNNVALETVDLCEYQASLGSAGSHPAAGEYYPFALVQEDSCSYKVFSAAEFQSMAESALRAKEWAALETEFERGTLVPTNPHLAAVYTTPAATQFPFSSGSSQATSLSFSPGDALALLDETISTWGSGLGMIHAPSFVIDKWVAARMVTSEEPPADTDEANFAIQHPTLISPMGNIIVAGTGYRGYAPDGTLDATHAAKWCYATDLVTVHRDARVSFTPSTAAAALNRTTNSVTWRAWRVYALAWNRLLHAAVKVNTVLAAAP
ncbi:MAG: hypothetical protein ABIQ32_10405 [Sphingomicrobium sp.]